MTKNLNFKEAITAGLFAGIAAAVVNLVMYFVFHAAGFFTDDIMIQPGQPLSAVPVIISSILPLIIGSIVFFLLEKYTNNGFKIFAIIAIVLTALSMFGPFKNIPNVTTSYALALCALHLPPAAAILYFINKAKKQITAN